MWQEALLFGCLNALGRSQAHEDADDVVPFAQQQRGGDGAIDSAAHGDDDLFSGSKSLGQWTV